MTNVCSERPSPPRWEERSATAAQGSDLLVLAPGTAREAVGDPPEALDQPLQGLGGLRHVTLSAMATAASSEPTPQRLAAIRDQLTLLADYL